MNKELLQQALAALVECRYATTDKSEKLADAAINALREALAQPVQPVAYITDDRRMLVFADNVDLPTTMAPLYAEAIAASKGAA